MPDGEGHASPYGDDAVEAVDRRLRETAGEEIRRLRRSDLALYPNRRFVDGWRVPMSFPDGIVRHLDILLHDAFPAAPPRIALLEHPPSLTWPHVEPDGVLCLLPPEAEVDPDDPASVVRNLVGRGARLVEELLDGRMVDRDFREEFLTYWAYDVSSRHQPDCLLELAPPSRAVRVCRLRARTIVGEEDAGLRHWIGNAFPDLDPRRARTEPRLFLWLGEPLLPREYPHRAGDLHRIASGVGPEAVDLLHDAAERTPGSFVVLLGANGRGGPGVVGVVVSEPRGADRSTGKRRRTIHDGFRSGRLTRSLAATRMFGSEPVERVAIRRADRSWVHGRGRDDRATSLAGKRVVVVGCGSVGGAVAQALAEAGTGHLDLVDYDVLSWANIGRHPLGAASIGVNKARGLASFLLARFPHLSVEAMEVDAFHLLRHREDVLRTADVVVAATGSWAAEHVLDRWHERDGRRQPFVYGWTETHAVAGHAVAIPSEGPGLGTGIGPTGVPELRLFEWASGDAAVEEPACGAHYHPYGPVELRYVTAMISDLTLECLLGTIGSATHRIWVTDLARATELGATPTDRWSTLALSDGARLVRIPWGSTEGLERQST